MRSRGIGLRRVATLATVAIALLAALGVYWWWQTTRSPRAKALAAAEQLERAVHGPNASAALGVVVEPSFLATKTDAERASYIRQVLADEIGEDGIKGLRKSGRFGPLTEVFPSEAANWAGAARVKAQDCVAFRHDGQAARAELVLVKQNDNYSIIRCNDVR